MEKENNKRIAKNTGLLYTRLMFTMFVGFFASRVTLEVLGVEDYGIYNVVGGVVAMFTFLNYSLGTINSRFLSYAIGLNQKNELKNVFRTGFTIQFYLAVIIFVLLESVGLWFVNAKLVIPEERLIAANYIYQFAVISAVIQVLQVSFTASIVAYERMKFYSYLGIVDVGFKLLVITAIYYSEYDKLITYGFITMICVCIMFIVYNIYCKKNFAEYSWQLKLEKTKFREMISFSGWSFIGSFSSLIKEQGNNILLNIFFGPAVNAARGIAFQVSMSVNRFILHFTTAINPQIIKYYAQKEYDAMIVLVFRGMRISYLLFYTLSLPILLNADFIIGIWLKDVPEFTVLFTQLTIINALVESITYVMGTCIQATGKIKQYQAVSGGLIMLNLPISYLLLKLGNEPHLVFWVSIILAAFTVIVRAYLISRIFPEFKVKSFLSKVIRMAFIVTIITSIPAIYVKRLMDQDWLGFITSSVFSICLTIGAILIFGLEKNERKMLVIEVNKRLKR